MSKEFIFFIWILISGLTINASISKVTPHWFKIASAFFIGLINWALVSLVFLVFGGGAKTDYVLLVVFIESIICMFIAISRKMISLSKKSIFILVIYLLLFCLCEYLCLTQTTTNITRDTLFYVLMGNEMAFTGLGDLKIALPSSYGFFTSLLQAPATFLGVGYIRSVHPLLSCCFFLFVAFWSYFELSKKIGYTKALLLAFSLLLFMYSSSIMKFMFSYIHSNNLSGIFLFLVLFCYYEFSNNSQEKSWFLFGSIFLAGFCLSRVENTIVSIILLLLLSHFFIFSSKEKISLLLPNTIFALFINIVCVYCNFYSPASATVENAMQYGLIAFELAFILYLLVSDLKPIKEIIKNNFQKILIIIAAIGLTFAFVTKLPQMISSTSANISTFFISGAWGATWYIVILLLAFFWNKNGEKFYSLLKVFIPIYYLVILLLSYFREPYHFRWTDSANRMFVQLFYTCIFFLITSIVHYLSNKKISDSTPISSDQEK